MSNLIFPTTAIVLPFLLGCLSLAGERADFYDLGFALALSVILNIAMLFLLTYIDIPGLFFS